jgi:hypothetical protein
MPSMETMQKSLNRDLKEYNKQIDKLEKKKKKNGGEGLSDDEKEELDKLKAKRDKTEQ